MRQGVDLVQHLVRSQRITAHDGAMLLELRAEIAAARRPRIVRWLEIAAKFFA